METNLRDLLVNYLAICEGHVPEEVSLLLSMPVWKANSYFMLLYIIGCETCKHTTIGEMTTVYKR